MFAVYVFTEITDNNHLKKIAKERPIVAKMEHTKAGSGANSIPSTSPLTKNGITGLSKVATDVGLLPLHIAASLRYPRVENITTLLEIYPDGVKVQERRGWIPLHYCAFNCRSIEVMKLLIQKYPKSPFRTNAKGQLPFQLAMANRMVDIIYHLYEENNLAVEAMDYKGNTPCHMGAKSFNPGGLKLLLRLCPQIAVVRNNSVQLPIHNIFQNLPYGPRMRARQLETIKVLLEDSPETAAMKDNKGHLPLHLATYYNTPIECIEALYNAYPSAALIRDGDGKLPVNYAQSPEIQKLLLKGSPPLLKVGIQGSFAEFTS